MELVIPVLLVILGAPVPGQLDRPVEEVRVTLSMAECETLRTRIRFEGGASRAPREMVCVALPASEDFERAYERLN